MIDGEGRIKLIDFGIASQTGARRLTFGKLSNVMGTPDYIAPEQVQGRRGDARSDVYALGVILYEMLTGEMPFPGSDPFVIMNDRLVKDPIPPCEIDPSIAPELPFLDFRFVRLFGRPTR
jgi:serine/threonine protein kinase